MTRDLSVMGRALAAPVRSTVLGLLMDGTSRPASELAAAVGVSAATTSQHLAVLLDAGLIVCRRRGRQRLYSIRDHEVAAALEQLGHLCPPLSLPAVRQSSGASALAEARLCYDHLAGKVAIAATRTLTTQNWVTEDLSVVTSEGVRQLADRGVDLTAPPGSRRPLVRPCPDWTERVPHVAGILGAALAQHFQQQGWLVRASTGRGLKTTRAGTAALSRTWSMQWH